MADASPAGGGGHWEIEGGKKVYITATGRKTWGRIAYLTYLKEKDGGGGGGGSGRKRKSGGRASSGSKRKRRRTGGRKGSRKAKKGAWQMSD